MDEAGKRVLVERDGPLALVLIDHPPVNATSADVRAELLAAIEALDADETVAAIVIAAQGRTFVAGADIREFDAPPRDPHLRDVVQRIEACRKPVVAALHGTTLGGGCEIALSCHARVMDVRGKIGLPEVKLGLLPGAGGTQRLPRLVGLLPALDLVTSGRMVSAQEALALGLVDEVVETQEHLRTVAKERARALIGQPLRRTSALATPPCAPADCEAFVQSLKQRLRGQIAPLKATEMVVLASTTAFDEAIAIETAAFDVLKQSAQSKAMRHVFFAERAAGQHPDLKGIHTAPVSSIGVVGAGMMGSGITVAALDAGLSVVLVEASIEALHKGLQRVRGLYERAIKSGRMTQATMDERLARLTLTQEIEALQDQPVVIEAIYENLDAKKSILQKLDAVVRDTCILASNTSYIDINVLAASTKRPTRVLGMHFFSPAHVMRLLEVVRGSATSPETLARALALGKQLNKLAVVVGVCEGFVGNRILTRFWDACTFMVEDGTLPQDIDAAFEKFGMAMGPFAVQDLAGLDISYAMRQRLAPSRKPNERVPLLVDQLVEMGRLGQKSGQGWYQYAGGKRQVDPVVTDLVNAHAPSPVTLSVDAIIARGRAAMVNEAAKILQEGIVPRASDIDLVKINGYGFPVWRGGLMFEAMHFGLDRVLAEAHRIARDYGPTWDVSDALIEAVETQRGFL